MKTVILETQPSGHWIHFVHYMQFLYWCSDIILNDINFQYIVIEPENKSNINYIKSYRDKILKNYSNVIFTNKYDKNNKNDKNVIYKMYLLNNPKKIGNFILNGEKKQDKIINWFPNNNSKKIRNLFLNTSNCNNIKIGLVNRKKNRILNNYNELCDNIKKRFNMEVDITYFEDKSFDYQIKFFNEHKIIISPHGAQLCSTPFSQDESLIIECVHEEWHPYNYFPGLSYSSNLYHVMICDDHSVFPTWYSDKYINKKKNRSDNSKLNINVNVEKIINIINKYLKNNNKLESHDIYLI